MEGALGEEEKEKKDCAKFGVFHGWNIPPLAAVSSLATWQLTQSAVYIVPSREIYHFTLYHGFISSMSCIAYFC